MTKARKFMVTEKFGEKQPIKSMFQIVEETLPTLKNNQFLVKAEYISVDPYMWSFARQQKVPYMQFGFQVGKVIESKNKNFAVNSYVVSHSGWCDYAIVDGTPDEMFQMKPYVPDLGKLSPSLALGALGMPGITAYLGLLEICKPKKGDIVCVSSAGGAVGSLVGQIARIHGCTVIGIAGSDHKVKALQEDFHFHYAFNYKTEENIVRAIKKVAPNGINCYFDNVGGTVSQSVYECLAPSARVAVCGAISTYREPARLTSAGRPPAQAHVEAFSFTQWEWGRQSDALEKIRQWREKRDITVKQTITDGFENLPAAFIGMLNGENLGKAVVKV